MKIRHSLSLTLLICIAGLLAGCKSVAKREAMIPPIKSASHQSSKPVKLSVVGDARVENKTQVHNADFAAALRTAIEKSGLFAKVDSAASDGYHLEVTFVSFTPPRPGFNMTATLITNWKLTRQPGNEVLFEDFIKKECTATLGTAFVGTARWRKAGEGAVREAIFEGVTKLSSLSL
jgi:hypothetical protein